MFLSCAVTSIFAVPLAQAAWRVKRQLPAERTERSNSYMRYQFNGRLRGKSGEGELLNCTEIFVLGTSVLVHTADQLMPWQRMEKTDTRKANKTQTINVTLKKIHFKPKSKLKAVKEVNH